MASSNRAQQGSHTHCCVPGCVGDRRYDRTVTFHRIPSLRRKHLRDTWIVKIRRDPGKYFQINDSTRVCSAHFVDSDFKPPDRAGRRFLKNDAVPSVFAWSRTTVKRRRVTRVSDLSCTTVKRCRVSRDSGRSLMEVDEGESVVSSSNSASQSPSPDIQPKDPDPERHIVVNDLNKAKMEIEKLKEQLEMSQRNIRAQEAELRLQKESSNAQIRKLQSQLKNRQTWLEEIFRR